MKMKFSSKNVAIVSPNMWHCVYVCIAFHIPCVFECWWSAPHCFTQIWRLESIPKIYSVILFSVIFGYFECDDWIYVNEKTGRYFNSPNLQLKAASSPLFVFRFLIWEEICQWNEEQKIRANKTHISINEFSNVWRIQIILMHSVPYKISKIYYQQFEIIC